jgi:1-phosphofructokinase family hexose kinase
MIITLTPNPTVDHTVFVDRLEVGHVNRFIDSQLDPAGKGINVTRMVHRLGWPSIAFCFFAGDVGRIAERALEDEGVMHHFIRVPGQTRLNTTIVEGNGKASTRLRGPGPIIGGDHRQALDGLMRPWLEAGKVLVLAGRLAPGLPDDFYADYVRKAKAKGLTTIVDADGPPLRHAVEAGPTLVKPNRAEAERFLGRPLRDQAAVLAGAREILRRGASIVVITLAAEGAVCARGDRAWRATPPAIERRSTVGSGDSFVAALAIALARGEDLVEGLRRGTAAGTATAASPGTALGTAAEVERLLPAVRVEEIVGP